MGHPNEPGNSETKNPVIEKSPPPTAAEIFLHNYLELSFFLSIFADV
jgi:hypothetical protein